jgi:1-phosphatidylinositol phosphodiesterase
MYFYLNAGANMDMKRDEIGAADISSGWRQVILNIVNNTDYEFTFLRRNAIHGRFESDPPITIKTKETGTFKVNKNDLGSTIGPQGDVVYQVKLINNLTLDLIFTWNHPQGSAKSAYTVYSNPPNCVTYTQNPADPSGHNQEITLEPFLQNLNKAYDIHRWMGSIDPDTSLADITIPGTHDTCARKGGVAAQCQTLSIPDQLALGVRYLDIRLVRKDDGRYVAYHGDFSQDITLNQIYDQCATFLSDNPSEVILMAIEQENNSSADEFARGLDAFINSHGKFIFLDSFPTLKEAAGKIVLLRRYPGSTQGIDCTGWPVNGQNWIRNDTVFIQDFYEVSLVPGIVGLIDLDTKWRYFKEACDRAGSNRGKMLINYISGSTGAAPKDIADQLNPKVYEKFSTAPKGKFGIVVMDFVDMYYGAMVPVIITTNTFQVKS